MLGKEEAGYMYQLYLAIEQNKLKNRFGGTVTTAILEVLNRETDEKH